MLSGCSCTAGQLHKKYLIPVFLPLRTRFFLSLCFFQLHMGEGAAGASEEDKAMAAARAAAEARMKEESARLLAEENRLKAEAARLEEMMRALDMSDDDDDM